MYSLPLLFCSVQPCILNYHVLLLIFVHDTCFPPSLNLLTFSVICLNLTITQTQTDSCFDLKVAHACVLISLWKFCAIIAFTVKPLDTCKEMWAEKTLRVWGREWEWSNARGTWYSLWTFLDMTGSTTENPDSLKVKISSLCGVVKMSWQLAIGHFREFQKLSLSK